MNANEKCNRQEPKLPDSGHELSANGEMDWKACMAQDILEDPAIRQAAVISIPAVDSDQDAVIVSLNQTDEEQGIIIKRVRKLLVKRKKQTGTEVSVPKQWMVVEHLPLTKDGQAIHIAALRRRVAGTESERALETTKCKIQKIVVDASASDEPHCSQATLMQQVLRVLWAHTLKLLADDVADGDSFLKRGGDSITAIELTTVALECDISLTVADVFQHPVLSDMATVASFMSTNTEADTQPFELLQKDNMTETLRIIKEQCHIEDEQEIEDVYPCSPLQEGLMALAIKQPGSYITRRAFLLPGHVDLDRFRSAWMRTLELCAILRTRIVLVNGRSLQAVIREPPPWDASETQRLVDWEQAPVDSIRYGTPLCRYGILSDPQSGQNHFLWTMHHGCFDGWTVRIVMDVLHQLYHGTNPSTSHIQPYANFVKYLQVIDSAKAAAFWASQLQDAKRADFPAKQTTKLKESGKPRINAACHTKTRIAFPYSASGSITKATVLRATWGIVLAKYCDTEDITFGTTVSGRQAPVPGLEAIPGPVVTTVPVRLRLDRHQKVHSFLEMVQDQASAMIAHEQYGLRNISQVSADAREACDFSSLLVVQPAMQLNSTQNDSDTVLKLGDLADEAVMSYFNYPLVVQAQVGDDDIELVISYDGNVLSRLQIEALSQHIEHVSRQLLAPGQMHMAEVTVAGTWDIEQAARWNQITQTDVVYECVHDIFKRNAAEFPEKEALYSCETCLSYRELDQLSDRLAQRLSELGVERERIVPICFEKSIWAVVAMMGVLKAGGAFVPLEPSHPKSRRRGIVAEVDAVSGVVLVSPELLEACQGIAKEVVPVSRSLLAELPPASRADLPDRCKALPENLSYVLFTSGSTGKPKGLTVEHSALATTLYGQNKTYMLSPATRQLQFSNYVWDPCIKEIFGPLVFGGTVCVPSEQERLNHITTFISEARVSTAVLTPSFLRVIDPDSVPTMTCIKVGGEATGRELIRTWQTRVRLINAFGPAEAVVACMLHVFTPDKDQPNNIGRGFHGAFWLVDPDNHDQLAPIGCVGELVVHGHCLARGYINNPQATAKSFILPPKWLPESFQPRYNGWRFYKTGDMARYNPDGTMEFIGRRDTQVKLRGQRLELGEIESAITSYSTDVKHVAVDIMSLQGRKSLVGFVSFKDEAVEGKVGTPASEAALLSPSESLQQRLSILVRDLKETLPSYMVPTCILPLNKMPFVSAMKIDRRVLRGIAEACSSHELAAFMSASRSKQPPSTDTEKQLAELWGSVLNVPASSIGREDSFLQIGGDSISAIQLVSLASKQGLTLTVPVIFENTSLGAMALAAVSFDDAATSHPALGPFDLITARDLDLVKATIVEQCQLSSKDHIQDAMPCTPLQEGLMALAEKQPGSYIAKQVYRLPVSVDVGRFRLAWEATVQHCGNLRTRIVLHQRASIQVVLQSSSTWESVQGLTLQGGLAALSRADMRYGLPLCRYALFETHKGNYFAWAIHHATFDGWSMEIILKTLRHFYLGNKLPSQPPFSKFIRYTSSISMEANKEYWTKQLQGAVKASFPPASTPDVSVSESRQHEKSIPFKVTGNSIVTRATIVRAAWALVLARYCNSDDICFGATVAGRLAPVKGVDAMAGPTIATVPIRVHIDRKQNVRTFLHNMQEQANGMIPFEQYGLQNISRISHHIREACDFTSLLVVQPGETNESEVESILAPAQTEVEFSTQVTLRGYFHYPLAVQAFVHKEHVELKIAYHSGLLHDLQMEGLCHHFETVLQQLSVSGDTRLEDVPLNGEWDEQMALACTKQPELHEALIQDLVTPHAQTMPKHHALWSTDEPLSYLQLQDYSERLALELVQQGVGPEVLVPICFEHSVWAVVAMLAVLRAGGAFVPLDPEQPTHRRQEIVTEMGATVLLASSSTASTCRTISQDVLEVSSASLAEMVPNKTDGCTETSRLVTPTNVAYILFDSDSSNTSKAVVMEHGAICSSIASLTRELGMDSQTRIFQGSSFGSKAAITEIFTTLSVGGTVCVPTDQEIVNDAPTFMRAALVNTAMLDASVLSTCTPGEIPSLRLLMLNGQVKDSVTLNDWRERRGVKVVATYGSFECCVPCIAHVSDVHEEVPNIIGKDLHLASWIVEPRNVNKLAPHGCAGELLLQGRGLARGYYKDAAKTEQAFMQDLPWLPSSHRGVDARHRLYRTGHLAKYDHNGAKHYLGPIDSLVQSRGRRVELADIECRLTKAHPDIIYVCVDITRRRHGDDIIAILFFNAGPEDVLDDSLSAQSLIPIDNHLRQIISTVREEIADTTPSHMSPTVYLPVRCKSLTAAKTVERNELHRFLATLSDDQLNDYATGLQNPIPDLTSMESSLLKLWGQVLELDDTKDIGRNDSFLQIGGDSISAIHLVSLARSRGFSLSVASVFKAPRLGDMALLIEEDTSQVAPQALAVAPFGLLSDSEKSDVLQATMKQCDLSSQGVIEDAFPCTALQEGLMALSVTQPGSYISRNAHRLNAHIQVERFKAAWEETIVRCPNLRTRIVLAGGHAYQVVLNPEAAWECVPSTEGLRDITVGYGEPLCRYAVYEEGPESSYFLLSIHHASYDGWTLKMILDTLRAAYYATSLPLLSPFSGFIQYTMSVNEAEAQAFWLKQVEGATPCHFPSRTLQDGNQTHEATQIYRKKIDVAARHDSITMATVVRAAWAVLMARYCETDDIVVGTTVSGRQAPVRGIEAIPGPMIATVPTRVRLSEDNHSSVSTFLQRLQKDILEAVPFEQYGLQNIAKLSEDAKRACEFSSLLIIQPAQAQAPSQSDILLLPNGPDVATEEAVQNYFNYPLVNQVFLSENCIELFLTYDLGAVSALEVEALAHQLEHVVTQLCTYPNQSLEDIELVGPWDVEHALLNSGQVLAPSGSCVHVRVMEQAAKTPVDVAVSAWDHDFSYAELTSHSRRLCARLNSLGVKEDHCVLICMAKSAWVPVAMLAVCMTGASFTAVDVTVPQERMRTMIEDTGAVLALVCDDGMGKLCDIDMLRVLSSVTDMSMAQMTMPSDKSCPNTGSPEDNCVILFTSGSTGRPKGIALQHQAICSTADGYGSLMGIQPGTRVFNFSSYNFDVGILDVLVTLMRGGCVCIPSEQGRLHDLAGSIDNLKANWAFLTPTVAGLLAPAQVPSMKTLCLGGEVVDAETVRRWKGSCHLYGGYGPAEASICACNSDLANSETTTNIGRPISSAFWIVEPGKHRLVPVGCVGELVVQGPLLAKGYLQTNAADHSAWMDDTDWLPANHKQRAYRTGDLVRRNADGTFEYMGRIDNQVKIHGQRVELGEIESQLKQALEHRVQEVVVEALVRDGVAETLATFLAIEDRQATHTRSIDKPIALSEEQHEDIQKRILSLDTYLPKHMMPSYAIPLGRLPQTTTGKLDRKALRSLASTLSSTELLAYALTRSGDGFKAPASDTEAKLRTMWSKVLHLDEEAISTEHNFYSLGGDSIRIVSLAQQTLKTFDVSLGRTLISRKNVTIVSMADMVEKALASANAEVNDADTVNLADEFDTIMQQDWTATETGLKGHPISYLPRYACVFLTGGTGYLGTELLHQLLTNPRVGSVVALVRCSSPSHGQQRIQSTAETAGWWDVSLLCKLEVWPGDLSQADLGLSTHQLSRLGGRSSESDNIHAIVHNGAVVNWNADYDRLREANVSSTIRLLRCAAAAPQGTTKFVFVSGGPKTNLEQPFAKNAQVLQTHIGYSQTKFMAESIVQAVASCAPAEQNRISVVKPGLIIGTKEQGIANVDDFLWRAVATTWSLGKFPIEASDRWLHIHPVDAVASSIVSQLTDDEDGKAVFPFHDLKSGMPISLAWKTAVSALSSKLQRDTGGGQTIEGIPMDNWARLAQEEMEKVGEDHPLWPVQHLLSHREEALEKPSGEEVSEHTRMALVKNIEYLFEIGFMAEKGQERKQEKSEKVGRIGRSNMAQYERMP